MASLDDVLITVGVRDNTDEGVRSAEQSIGSLAAPAAIAGAGAGALFAMGIQGAMDISGARSAFQNQLGLTGAEAERAGSVAGDVYTKGFGSSMEEVTSALGAVHSSIGELGTFSDSQLEGMSKSALSLSKTFGVDVNESVGAVGQLIKTGLVKDATEGFDLVTKTMQSVPANMREDILPTIQEYGTQFRKVGLDGATSMGLISQGLKAGARDADIVADSIKEFSIRAVDGSKATSEGFDALGLNAGKMAERIGKGGKSASTALDETLDALRNVEDPVKRSQIAVSLFGTQAEDLGDALFALDPSAAAAATGLDKAKGSAKGLSDNLEASPAQQYDAAIRTLQETLGSALLPVITMVSEFMGENKGLMQVAVPVVLALAAALGVAAIAQWAMNSALLANPMTWIVIGIVALVAALVVLWTKCEGFRAVVTAVWNAIKTAMGATFTWIKEQVFAPLGRFFTSTIPGWAGTLKEKVTSAWNGIKSGVSTALNFLKNLFLNWTGPGLIIKHWDKIKSTASTMAGKLKEYWNNFISFFKGIPGKISSVARGMWNGITSGFKSAVNSIIRGWNNLSFTVGGGSFMGVSIPSFTLGTPNIPYLAKGGVTTGPTLAMIGEGREQEAVLPLSKLQSLLDQRVARAYAATASRRMAPVENRLTLELKGGSRAFREFFQESVRVTAGGSVVKFAEG